jgi:lipopolysaccharide export system permease protein
LVALELFFVGIDFMQNAKSLDGANLQILYIFYNFAYALNFTLSISVILAFIVTSISLIKTNYLVAIYSIGYSKRDILRPIFLSALAVTLTYVSLNFTEFAYAKDKIDALKDNRYLSDSKSDLFLKYNNFYIYFAKLYPIEKRAEGIEIFVVDERQDLIEIIKANDAKFINNSWFIDSATLIKKPKTIDRNSKIEILENQSFKTLDGFKPRIIDNVYEAKASFSILDAIESIKLLNLQNISTEKIKAILLSVVIFPLFAPLFIVLLFYFIPTSYRFFNVLLFSSTSVFISLGLWGVLFTLVKLSISGVISPEIAILLPIVLLSSIALILYYKRQ